MYPSIVLTCHTSDFDNFHILLLFLSVNNDDDLWNGVVKWTGLQMVVCVWPCVATQARLRLLHSAMEPTDAQSVSSNVSGSSSGSTAASEGDFWKGYGYQCDRCGRPWKWYPYPQVCQHCRDMHVHRQKGLLA